jgi:threonyl-tRNA synthetase
VSNLRVNSQKPQTLRTAVLAAGTAAGESLRGQGLPLSGAQGALAVRTSDGIERDLDWAPAEETKVELLTRDSVEGLAILRHSTAHILAQAVQNTFPGARLGIGPPIDEGFYYDFLTECTFDNDDLQTLTAEMNRLIDQSQSFHRRVQPSLEAAQAELADEPLKLELIADHAWSFGGADSYGEEVLSFYDNEVDGVRVWSDLCRGPHVSDTKQLGVFSLTHTAAAYWRGDESRPQLQRIYGTSFPDRKSLKAFLAEREERLKRDHRKIGEELDLFTFDSNIGKGLPLWLPAGTAVRDELENWARETERSQGYKRVVTPHLAKEDLYYLSGHLPYYTEDLYSPIEIEGERYYLRPMNCPHHHAIYSARPRSYRELPLKIAEYGTVYRFERSGQLQGLMRVRGFTQNDAHIYCRKDQAEDMFLEVMKLHEYYYTKLGLTDFHMELALRDPKNIKKYHQDEEMWQEAEEITRRAMERSQIPYVLDIGGAAHYGPKVDFIVRAVSGKEFAASTNQVDLYTPKQFDLTFKDSDGQDKQLVVIHRAPLGSHERFVAFLIEHFAGNFPFWLAPQQISVIPVSEHQSDAAAAVADRFYAEGFRVEADLSDARMQAKIRHSVIRKVPLAFVVGAREAEDDALSVRQRDGREWRARTGEVLSILKKAAADRVLDLDEVLPAAL